jgi:UDP-2,3-diacylglucosamine pyrophosphatase LpxH
VQQEATHITADGRRFLVLHGDRCDLTPHGALHAQTPGSSTRLAR